MADRPIDGCRIRRHRGAVLTRHRVRLLLAAAAWLALVVFGSAIVLSSQMAACLGGPFSPEGIRECSEAPGRLIATIGSPVVLLVGWLAIALVDWADHHWW